MADLDLARIKRNVAKMASMNAPVEDIDGYIASEGTTIDAVRSFRAAPAPSPSEASAPPPVDGMDGSGQRFEGGVPVGGRPLPAPAGGSASRGSTIAPPVPKGDGMLANTTAGINEGIYGVAGLPVDLVRGGMNMAVRGANAVTGADLPEIPENSFGGSRWIGETMGEVHPALDPANTVAATPEERVARVGGQGIGGTVAPAGVATGMLRAGMVPARAVPTVEMMAGRTGSAGAAAGDAVAGGAAGIGSGVAMENVPDEWKPTAALAGGVAGGGIGMVATGIPALMREGGRLAARAAEPFTAGGQQRQAARALREGATDPQSILDADVAGAELVPGSMPTTGQLTGDMGTLAMERGSQTRFPAEFNQRRADQNAARVGTLEGIQPGGAPEKVAQSVRSFLQSIDTEADTAIGSAMEAARASAGRVGAGMRPDEAGASVRGALEAARATAKERERALWSAVDPNGTLALRPGSVRQQAADIVKSMPASAKPPSGEEAAILDVLGRYGEVVPFGEVSALSSRIKAEMRAERMANGETPAYARLARLNGALQQDLETAVVGRARFEAREVAEGRMAPENTMEARWRARAEDELAGETQARATGSDSGAGPSFAARGEASALPGQAGAGRQAGGRSGGAAGDPRLSGFAGDPNFDAAAQERLTAANTATRERAQTFDNSTLGPIRKRPATNAPYDMPASAVPARIFFGRPQSAEAMARYAQAVGPDQARATIEPYAVDQARRAALRDDGTFDPARLDRWRRQHQDALRAMPELDARLADAGRAGETMGEVATAQRQASEAAQKGALGRMVGIDGPEEVTRAVGSLFGRQDGPTQLAAIKRAIGNDPEALEGLRKAVADHVTSRLIGNTEVGTSGVGGIKSDQYQTFVRQNAALLRVVFTPNELRAMEAVAVDLQRANRSLVAARIPGQSNTAQDTLAVQSKDAPATMLAKLIGTSAAAGGGVGVATGSMSGIAVGAGTMFAGALREAGLRRVDELVRDALLDPRKAKILLETVRPDDRAKELGLVRRFRATLPAVGGIAMGGQEPQPARGPMDLPDYMRQSMARPQPQPLPSSGNPLLDAVAARQQASPPWMQDGGQVSDLQRVLAARGGL